VREADNLTTFMCRMSWKSGSLNLLEHPGPQRACYGIPLQFDIRLGIARTLFPYQNVASIPSLHKHVHLLECECRIGLIISDSFARHDFVLQSCSKGNNKLFYLDKNYCDLSPADGVNCILLQSVCMSSVCGIRSDTAGAGRFCTTAIQTVEVRERKCRKQAIRSNSDGQYMSC
jgi:hypothetical protein